MRLKITTIKYLIVIVAVILIYNKLTTTEINTSNNLVETVRYIESTTNEPTESEYIISEEMVMSALRTESQIVSLQQNLHKRATKVDSKLFGERKTEIEVNGTYKMGLNTQDIKVTHIDSSARAVYIDLPEPVLISLELPFDEITFDKTRGLFRRSMNEEEEKQFYRTIQREIVNELMSDEQLLRQVNLFNQDVISDILTNLTDVKYVVFK